MIQAEKGTDLILESGIKEDATWGKRKVIENFYIQCICVKVFLMRYVKYWTNISKISIKI